MARKILSFKSSPRHYKTQACIVWCFDYRFRRLRNAFARKRRYTHPDFVVVAGGAKSLSSPRRKSERAYVLDQIEKSIALHHAPRVILMTHSDCGAYGGLGAFGNKNTLERKKHRGELKKAAALVKKHVPRSVSVETVFADFEGLHTL